MGMKKFHITRTEFHLFKALQVTEHRRGWWAVFSVNRHEDVWPFVCYGVTPIEKRKYVPRVDNRLLFDVARYYLSNVCEDGGRFFINLQGAYCIKGESEDLQAAPVQFIEWLQDELLLEPDKPPIPEESRTEYLAFVAKRAEKLAQKKHP
jgi:hypothetical protein